MDHTDFQALLAAVNADQTPRVWSLLVTIFGDLAQAPDVRVSGAALHAVLGRTGIRPEAVRVAIHRLRKDGWIDSQRQGRTSTYGLNATGRTESQSASPRIYGPPSGRDAAFLILANPANPVENRPAHWVQILPNTFIAPECDSNTDLIGLPVEAPVPQWLSNLLCPIAQQDASRHLAAGLTALDNMIIHPETLDAVDIVALRMVIIHHWRRLILKAPELPEWLFSDQWAGGECRAVLARLLAKLPLPGLDQLENTAARKRPD